MFHAVSKNIVKIILEYIQEHLECLVDRKQADFHSESFLYRTYENPSDCGRTSNLRDKRTQFRTSWKKSAMTSKNNFLHSQKVQFFVPKSRSRTFCVIFGELTMIPGYSILVEGPGPPTSRSSFSEETDLDRDLALLLEHKASISANLETMATACCS